MKNFSVKSMSTKDEDVNQFLWQTIIVAECNEVDFELQQDNNMLNKETIYTDQVELFDYSREITLVIHSDNAEVIANVESTMENLIA